MNNVWLMILGVMVVGSIVKYIIINRIASVVINFVVLGAVYFILRRYPYLDMKRSMIILGGMTIIISLTDLGIVSGFLGEIGLLLLIVWMFYNKGGRSGRPQKQRHQWHK